jgi:hypothetical protein
MERAHGRKNGGADPRRVLPLGGRHDLNLLVDGASAVSISVLADACKHRSAARERNVTVSVFRMPRHTS